MTDSAKRIVLLGVGNIIMGDEGIGVRCVERLEASGKLAPNVAVVDGGTSTHELLGDIEDVDVLVIVDAAVTGGDPGSLIRLEGDRIPHAFSNKMSPHQHGINDLLASLQLLDRAPKRVIVHGMMPAVLELGMELSPQIEAAMPALEAAVLAELSAL
jgi:hydrogenase maturation protease